MRIFLLVILVFGGAGVAAGATGLYLETRDPFCAACHTQPETIYYRRSVASQAGPVDLAAFHRFEVQTRCIDCHGGVGPRARLETLVLAAGDTVQFVTGLYEQPAVMAHPMANPNCRQCHEDAVGDDGFENHFHNLMDDAEAPHIFCVACHLSHQEGDERAFFIRDSDVFPGCNDCHAVMGGPSELK